MKAEKRKNCYAIVLEKDAEPRFHAYGSYSGEKIIKKIYSLTNGCQKLSKNKGVKEKKDYGIKDIKTNSEQKKEIDQLINKLMAYINEKGEHILTRKKGWQGATSIRNVSCIGGLEIVEKTRKVVYGMPKNDIKSLQEIEIDILLSIPARGYIIFRTTECYILYREVGGQIRESIVNVLTLEDAKKECNLI